MAYLKNTGFVMLLLLVSGCYKESTTLYTAWVKNTTTHQIRLIPYFSGVIYNSNLLLLQPGDSVKIADGFDRGIVDHGGFTAQLLTGSDSLHVEFDGIHTISHYFNTPAILYPKHYLYSSLRNFGNYLGWEYKVRDISKHRREAFYLYRFTEQDFLDAK